MPPESEPIVCDALVLGGGPAGAGFALRATELGLRVVLVERHGYDTARPGEHIAGSARARLAALGVPAGLCRFSPGVLSFWHGAVPSFRSYAGGPGPPGFNADRARLDAALFAAAGLRGARTILGAMEHIAQQGTQWHAVVRRTADARVCRIRAMLVIDATGRRAAFLHSIGVARCRIGDQFALVTWIAPSPGLMEAGSPLMIGATRDSWWSLTDAGDGMLSLTVHASRGALRAAGATIAEALPLTLRQAPYLRERLRRLGAQIVGQAAYAVFPSRAEAMAGEGWLAVGDAAIAFDPISGLGFTKALETAERAAELAAAGPGASALRALYADALADQFETHLRRRADAYAEANDALARTIAA
ncbi:NAD(P)/FAD-dependent oxidoreductase [Humitalea sp. 24SJ18S-53]|uniref:NAD(P)/FAD-dependent oxidoreductase n=1 Tax=Humitalea sp. 24SJ18S-53 TaxID=3422307 RepID=UPI003D67C6E9